MRPEHYRLLHAAARLLRRARSHRGSHLAALACCALAGCGGDGAAAARAPITGSAAADAATPVVQDCAAWDAAPAAGNLPGRPALCDRAGADAVRDVFCGPQPAAVGGLRELQSRLQLNDIPLSVDDAAAAALQVPPSAITDRVVFLGHSTALAGHLVSPINPRALLLGRNIFMAFQRGIQQVELASFDRDTSRLNLYLLTFTQACNAAPGGCTPGDLYTPRIEHGWASTALRDDEELKNTAADCRQCHQRGRATPLLLMRELRGPWTHFFAPAPEDRPYVPGTIPSGRDLVADFQQAKAGELYAGLPSVIAAHTAGFTLQNIVESGQPVDFDSSAIGTELAHSDMAPAQPRRSSTWDKAYQAFKRGEQLALPHFESRPTDPAKQAKLTQAYQRYRAQQLCAEQLPDLADIFPDDPQLRAEIGLQTEPGATPAQALIQACGSCHNDVLDQALSRARFNIALGRMSRAELDLAVARIEQPAGSEGVMPPPDARQIDGEGRARLLAYLRGNERSAQDDALLESAAKLGMAQPPP